MKLYPKGKENKLLSFCSIKILFVYTLIRQSKYFTWTLKHIHLMPQTLTKVDELPLLIKSHIFISNTIIFAQTGSAVLCFRSYLVQYYFICKVEKGHNFCLMSSIFCYKSVEFDDVFNNKPNKLTLSGPKLNQMSCSTIQQI